MQYGVAVPPSAPAVWPAQSVFDRHATHWSVDVSQTGAAAVVHWGLLVQPATQRPAGPHTGVAPALRLAQSASDTHWTQVPVDVSQVAVLPTQAVSSLAEHCTQVCVVLSQMGRLVEQAPGPLVVPGMQPTHAPVVVSHTPAGQLIPASPAHDA